MERAMGKTESTNERFLRLEEAQRRDLTTD